MVPMPIYSVSIRTFALAFHFRPGRVHCEIRVVEPLEAHGSTVSPYRQECEKLMANFEAKKTMRSQEIDALEAKKKALEPWPEAVELCESLVANLWS